MIKKLYIILCVCMKISLVAAQTIIQGSVLNEQGKATEAFVMVSPKGMHYFAICTFHFRANNS